MHNIYIKRFHTTKGVKDYVFFFYFKKTKKKYIQAHEDFWFQFNFGFFRPWFDLTRFLEYFLGILDKKNWNWVFWWKKQWTPFFNYHNVGVSIFGSVRFWTKKNNQTDSLFFLKKNRNRTETESNRPVSVRSGFLFQKTETT